MAGLFSALRAGGASVELVEPQDGMPDLVFTANSAVVLDGRALVARFRHPQRQVEEPVFAEAFHGLRARGLIDDVVMLPPGVTLEGAGDCLWDVHRRLFWMGCGFRSGVEAREIVSVQFGVPCVALALADPTFYHLDTCFSPLPCGAVMYYPAAFTTEGLALIHARTAPEQRIALSRDDAACFAANAVTFGRTILLSSCSQTLRAGLRSGLHGGGDAAHNFPPKRWLSLLPDAAAGLPVGRGYARGACRESCAQKVNQGAFHRTTMASPGLLRDLFWSDDESPLMTQSGH